MEDFVPTRAAQFKCNAKKLHMVTAYEAPKKVINPTKKFENSMLKNPKMDKDDTNIDCDSITEKRKQEIEMKKYRYDIIKFGMTGLQKTQVRQAKIALAISLGAKPPKNKKINYKKLIQQRKIKQLQEKKKEKFSSGFNTKQLLKNKKNICNTNRKNNKGSEILESYGKVTKDKQKQKNKGQTRREKK